VPGRPLHRKPYVIAGALVFVMGIAVLWLIPAAEALGRAALTTGLILLALPFVINWTTRE
jgi:hypothetical protein